MFVKRITDESLVIGAPAKVNLFLEILGRRPDGYHAIHSLFQAVSLFDRMEIHRTVQPGVALKVKGPTAIPLGPERRNDSGSSGPVSPRMRGAS